MCQRRLLLLLIDVFTVVYVFIYNNYANNSFTVRFCHGVMGHIGFIIYLRMMIDVFQLFESRKSENGMNGEGAV